MKRPIYRRCSTAERARDGESVGHRGPALQSHQRGHRRRRTRLYVGSMSRSEYHQPDRHPVDAPARGAGLLLLLERYAQTVDSARRRGAEHTGLSETGVR